MENNRNLKKDIDIKWRDSMLKLVEVREIQIGLIIFFVAFFSLLFSGVSIHMAITHALIIIMLSVLLITYMIQVLILMLVPNVNRLKRMRKSNYFKNTHKILFFFIYFDIITLIIGLFAEAIGDISTYNILLVSMFMTTLYNLLISTMMTFNFIRLSVTKDDI